MSRFTLAVVILGCLVNRLPAQTVEQRVQDLLSRMTLDEKIQQLRAIDQITNKVSTNGAFDESKAANLMANGIGDIGPMNAEPASEVALRNAIQKYLIEKTRLGIPATFHDEACHGFRSIGATSFPIPIGLACSWDPEMIERAFIVAGNEARARGVTHVLAPVVDITRDARWGRTDETLGEDPYLNGKLGAAMVRGLQGSADGTIKQGHVAATLKHLAGHGAPQAGINRAPADVSLREMYDAHLVPFRIAIAEGHPAAIMPSYNEVNGLPSHANPWLLQDVLRKEFKYTGLIVSDYTGVEYLFQVHGLAANMTEAAFKAFSVGVEVNLPAGQAYRNLKELVDAGRISKESLDHVVGRVLRHKFANGVFDQPYGDAQKSIDLPQLDSSKQLALEAARKSIILLKNANNILPLPKDKYKTIAVVGPNAASARLGSYSGDPLYKISVLEGIQKKLGDAVKVLHAEGCKITRNLPENSRLAWNGGGTVQYPTDEENRTGIAQAVEVAKQADLIVLVIGENEQISREAWAGNHIGDRVSIELIGGQNDLADAMFALGKPVVVYLMNGRPLAIPKIVEKADAILEGWYMGQETGTAAADILFGDVNPSGKLTITIPRFTGQVPVYYNHKPGARIYNYVDATNQPLYQFGFGLSYTTFSYSDPALSALSMAKDRSVTLSATVTNSGNVAGDEVVQFYIRQKVGSVTRPVKELRGFKRISLPPGQSKTVEFTINRETLAYHDINMNYTTEPGEFDLMVGPSSVTAQLKRAVLRVTE